MIKTSLLLCIATLLVSSNAWISSTRPVQRLSTTSLSDAPESSSNNVPCWQDVWNEDCTMDTAYAANFVASDWLKSMPCAQGLEDCDMPEGLTLPGNRVTEDVDVMSFLNLKRAGAVETSKKGDSTSP